MQLEYAFDNLMLGEVGKSYSAFASDWSNAGFTPVDAVEWTAIFLAKDGQVDIELARGCYEVGIWQWGYLGWREWGLSGQEIVSTLKQMGIRHADDNGPPSIGYKKFGFDLSEAIQLSEVFFSAETEDDAEVGIDEWDYIGYWSQCHLNVNELVLLKSQVNSRIEEFNRKHRSCEFQLKDWSPNLGPTLSKSLKALRESKLTISVENLLKFWGLSKIQILKAIDMGAYIDFAKDVSFAGTLVRSGISASKVKIVEYLMLKGVEKNDAIELTARGFRIEMIEKIAEHGYSLDDLVDALKKFKSMKFDVLISWLCVDIPQKKYTWMMEIAEWLKFGFTPESAAGWYREEFSAKDAKAWVDSGAKTPAIAKRRKTAGIRPI